ncbi:hypothetical protein B0A49_03046 [Cryomyces minteri]|uniref:DUF7704 domain-containing protein n=1 Tax=Cryomyces minteri TaxID=331657 RepID=A0A4U0XLF0_9PEZI|nr:hypothetical protein B0A49_03046 [Cryomyces minteri]
MASLLPPTPRFVFTVIEPLALIAGAIAPFVSPSEFVSAQLAHIPRHPLLPSEQILALQIGNLYLLLAMLGLFILNSTSEIKTVRAYLIALWVADIGHVAVTAWAMGCENIADIRRWNYMAWGNIGSTSFLFATRSLYLLGAFEKDMIKIT